MDFKRTKYGDTVLPQWADGLGWCLSMTCVFPIIGFAIKTLVETRNAYPNATVKEVCGIPD